MKEKYDEKKCKGCLWKTKCDEGHFVCFWSECHKDIGVYKRDGPKVGEADDG